MKFPPEHLIDACIAQLNNGIDLETVLEAYPEEADEFRPLLAAVAWMKMDIPAPVRRGEGKQALMAAAVRRRREVDVTQGYLNELNAGVPFEEIFAHAEPAMRSLLVAAWRMFSTEPPTPNPARRAEGKQRLMTMAAQKRAERQRELAASMSPASHLRAGFVGLLRGMRPRPSVVRRMLSGTAALTAVLAALAVGGSDISTAAADSLPGEAFYRVKRLGESARMVFAFDPARRAELNQSFSRARLAELIDLAAGGRELPEGVLDEWTTEERNVFAAIRRLPLAQQEALGEALISSFGDAETAGEAIGSSAGEGLLAWLNETAGVEPEPVSTETWRVQEILPLELHRAPMPVQRPLPPEEQVEGDEIATVEPPVYVEVAPAEDVLPEESVQFVQPAPPVEDDDDDGDERPAADDAPADEAPAAEPTDDNQFVLPPMEDPTPTPEDPGAGEDPGEPEDPEPTEPDPAP